MQQTAVEWLVEELTRQNMYMHLFEKEVKQAKKIEKQQIVNAFNIAKDLMKANIEESADKYYHCSYIDNN